jgi:hypothetical protein
MSSFIDWCNQLAIGIAIRKSTWLFPIIETVHLIALTILLGSVVIVAMRLFGLTLRAQKTSKIATELAPWTMGAVVVMVLTGALLFVSEPVKCYNNPPFRIKMVLLLLAVLYHFTLYRKWTRGIQPNFSEVQARIAAVLSLILWFGVGLAGRAIGFY